MAKGRILIIDDEEDLIELVRYNLEQEGFQVKGATDGEIARAYEISVEQLEGHIEILRSINIFLPFIFI